MNNEAYEKYNQKREAILKEFRQKKVKNVFAVLGIGIAALALILILGLLLNRYFAVAAVIAMIVGIFTILYARIRAVTIHHVMQKELLKLEDQYSLHSNF